MLMLRIQLIGSDDTASELINRLAAIEGIEHVEEVSDLLPHMDDEDSSSAGLPDDEGPGLHQIDIQVPNAIGLERVREVTSALARDRDASIEFDDAV